jgi:hypothetical protein
MLKRAQITFDTIEQNLKIAHSTQKKYHVKTAKETQKLPLAPESFCAMKRQRQEFQQA